MAQLYTDRDLGIPLTGSVLFEGVDYFLDTAGHSKAMIAQWLLEESMTNAVSHYLPQNRIMQLRFDNLVGLVDILGMTYDVRSRKLLDGIAGNRQFQTLLDDINELSRKLTFQFDGSTYAYRATELEYNQNVLEILDYYYQLVFDYPVTHRLQTLIDQCIRSPHSAYVEIQEIVPFTKSRKLATNFYTTLGKKRDWVKLQPTHKLAGSSLARRTFERAGNYLVPANITNRQEKLTLNTMENRFLRFFMEEIITLCLQVITEKFEAESKRKAGRLHQKVHAILQLSFFKEIASLSFLPGSSVVLLKKAGYKEIYYHFVQSKFSFRPILNDLREQAQRPGLKNIATLYEIWVFFKIAALLFPSAVIRETFGGRVLKNGSFVGNYIWEGNGICLMYNQSYSRLTGGSYSVMLRPDISLQRNDKLYLFDAKYKFNTALETEDELIRVVKPEDVHKMHAYVDAISQARTAIVLYPGTTYVFYDKNLGKLAETYSLQELDGVGAVPLLPGADQLTLKNLLTFRNEG